MFMTFPGGDGGDSIRSRTSSKLKIRVSELCRELEVKSSVILDMLPDLGVTEKKTHSSSLDEGVAEKIRRRLTGQPDEEQRAAAPEDE